MPPAVPQYNSDVLVDTLRALGVSCVSLNPGSSFRGLHDSLVNYAAEGEIELIECAHENVAVQIAHGYAKATGRMMAVAVHDVVGLLHGALAIYYAHIDRVPMLILGGSGPAAYDRRRPHIDWIHSANVQGNAVRDFTKWDAQPATLDAAVDAMRRGCRIATTEPCGPVYVALDAWLQEAPLDGPPRRSARQALATPSRMAPDATALRALAARLVEARRPTIVAGYVGRDEAAFADVAALAELLGAAVIDSGARLSMPVDHPLCVSSAKEAVEEADCVLFLDTKDLAAQTQEAESESRVPRSRLASGCTVLELGFHDIGISAWSEDYGALVPADITVTADTAIALPALLELCHAQVDAESGERRDSRQARRDAIANLHDRQRVEWRSRADAEWHGSPVSTARLAAEVGDALGDRDWVLTAGTAGGWAKRLWAFDRPYRHVGDSLGTATQIGLALGVALAYRDTDRFVVDLQPDGDLMFNVGALWTAAYHRLPLLVVTVNNRAYYNDWEHQEVLARARGRSVERAYIGMELADPAPDFATLARGFSWYADGPVDDPDAVASAVRRAADHVEATGEPALVDVICRRPGEVPS